jgi:hypothetical protein
MIYPPRVLYRVELDSDPDEFDGLVGDGCADGKDNALRAVYLYAGQDDGIFLSYRKRFGVGVVQTRGT